MGDMAKANKSVNVHARVTPGEYADLLRAALLAGGFRLTGQSAVALSPSHLAGP